MLWRKWRAALILASVFGLIASIFPLVPVVESADVVQTQMRRFDHARRADFASGQFDGGMSLLGNEDSPRFTLASTGTGTFTSPAIDLGIPASSVAAHWAQNRAAESEVSFAIRTSLDGTSWSEWEKIEDEGGTVTDDEENVYSTLAFGNGARYAQYRITLSANGSQLPYVSAVSLFAIDSASTPPRPEVSLRLVPRDSALAAIKPLGIVSRKQWGANEKLRFAGANGQQGEIWPEEVQSVEKIVVHHTAGPNVCSSTELYCQKRSVVAINDIYYYHTVANGWGDIGYNSLIGYDGRIYEGRHGPGPEDGVPLDQPVVAGHALGYNNRTHGVALMGDFQDDPVPDLEYDALERLVGWIVKSKLAAGGAINPLGFSGYTLSNGQVRPALPNIIGHRDVNDTECPGEYLYERLSHLREQVERYTQWPPATVELRAEPEGEIIAYHILVDNHEPDLVKHLTIKGAIPTNTEYVDSWAGSPNTNRAKIDGSVVTWVDPQGQIRPGTDRREYVFLLRPRPGVARADVRTTAWVEFTQPAPGIAMSEEVSADQPVEVIADTVVGGVTWKGDWPLSHNVGGYYGDSYQVHTSGDGAASYTWQANLLESGSYEVFGWWTAADDRATDAPYTVYAKDGAHVVRANQQLHGAQWVSLGTYAFDKGRARVTLSDDADGVVIADAIRLRKVR